MKVHVSNFGGRRRLMTALFVLTVLTMAPSTSRADEQACANEIRSASAEQINCDLAVTFPFPVKLFFKVIGWSELKCSIKISATRTQLKKALRKLRYTLAMRRKNGTCDVYTNGRIDTYVFSLSPVISFEKGTAQDTQLNLRNEDASKNKISDNVLSFVNSSSIIGSQFAGKFNDYLSQGVK